MQTVKGSFNDFYMEISTLCVITAVQHCSIIPGIWNLFIVMMSSTLSAPVSTPAMSHSETNL